MRRLVAVFLMLLAVAGAAFTSAFILRPVRLSGELRKAGMALAGVQRARLGTLASWQRDLCEPGAPCRCVALIHGLGDSALTWDKILTGEKKAGLPPPPPGTFLAAVELPGTEGSAPPASPEGFSIPALARTVREALEPRCSSWTVVGNSLGGWVAGHLAADWPQGVERLVLANPAGLEDPTGASEATARLLAEPTVEGMKGFSQKAYHEAPKAPERAWPEVVAGIKERPAKAMVEAMRREHVLDARAKDIRAPAVVVWGESDRAIPRAVGERFAKLIPGAVFAPAAACGHLPQRECPDAVHKAIFGRIGP